MTDQVDLAGNERPVSRDQAIRDLFGSLGAVPMHELATACIENGIYDADDLDALALRAVMSDCRRALKARDINGLPFAGPSVEKGESGPVWKTRTFWAYADYEINIQGHIDNINENHHIATMLAVECTERYGHYCPFVPLVEGELARI